MVVHEFRIPLPLTVEEFSRGQLYMTAQTSLENSKGDEGIEWIKNEPYDNTDGSWGVSELTGTVVPRTKGIYTLKRYHFKSKVPTILAKLAPNDSLFLIEEAWNAYPHCKTTLVNGYLSKDTMRIEVETLHVDNVLDLDEALEMTPQEKKARKVEYIDIAKVYADKNAKDYDANKDLTLFHSEKTGRGPLQPDWQTSGKTPLMCAYKLVRADFKIFGLQSTGENLVINNQRTIFGQTLCHAVATIDKWVDMTPEDIRRIEDEVAAQANAQLAKTVANSKAIPVAKK